MNYLRSSVGRKHIMGLTGLGLSLFVLTHMIGNLLIFAGPEAYNSYSHALITNHLIYVAEGGLLALFLVHVFFGVQLTIENRRARTQRYAMSTNGEKGVNLASKTMIYHGLVLLVFTVYHLITFKFGPHYDIEHNGVQMRDLHRLVIEVFQSPAYVAWYVFSLILLGVHLSHGFGSAFQSIGVNHPRYNGLIKRFGHFYAVIVTIGFLAPPLYIFFNK